MVVPVSTAKKREKAVLFTVEDDRHTVWSLEDRIKELEELASSCGVRVVTSRSCRRKNLTPDLFAGRGKIEELAEITGDLGADVVIFNNELSPSQQKNLEDILGVKTIDRTQLILDIFAGRAVSDEGKVQVELAQLLYLLPRLGGKGIQLSRLGGGVGTRGPGEQKLEVDRRRVRERISRLKKDLDAITKRRSLRRSSRDRFSSLSVALVGYTNSGKSTLFNALTGSGVKQQDRLFSTLDPTVRKIELPNRQTALISDTVGFLRELPHHLIESFKATLEEVVYADVLFLVLDMSDALVDLQYNAVMDVLRDLGSEDKPVVIVLNKSDKVADPQTVYNITSRFDRSVVISAIRREGTEKLTDILSRYVQKDMEDIDIVIPPDSYHLSGMIHDNGTVHYSNYGEKGLTIKARVPRKIKYAIFKHLKERK